jgi:transposase-like protein
VLVRARPYLNNITERDHRAIKARCEPMRGCKSFDATSTTLAGIELAHRIRKRQFICQSKERRGPLNLRREWYAAIMV